jgi:dTDP-4-dehydrorhamnose reductase
MRILVTGAGGQLGAYVLDELATRGSEVVAWGRVAALSRSGQEIEGLDFEVDGWEERLEVVSPDVVMHLAALSAAEAVRKDPERGRRINVDTTRRLAEWCERRGRGLVFTSTDLVFAGTKPFSVEDDPAEPVLAYGRTKREAEPFVLATPRGLVARVSLLYGFSRSGRDAYFDRTIAALRRGEPQSLFEDEFRTPLDLGSAASALIGLVEAGATGIVHIAGVERISRFDLIRRAAVVLGIDPSLVHANRCADVLLPEPRPADVSLDTARLAGLLPDLQRPTVEVVLRPHAPVL